VQEQPLTPLIVELAEPATEEVSIGDVLAGVFSITGVVVLVAVGLAVLFAGALILLRRLRPSNPLNGDETNRTKLGLHTPSN